MTIGKNMEFLDEMQRNKGNILPSEKFPDVPDELPNYTGFEVIADDFMVTLHQFNPVFYVNTNGQLRVASTFATLTRLFKPILDILNNTDVHIYAICLDPFANPRPEKKATSMTRRFIPPGEPDTLPLPAGQDRFFLFEQDFPAPNMGLIFRTPSARREFYHVVTEYLANPSFRNEIPENKMVVLCGGYDMGVDQRLPPLYLSTHDAHVVHDLAFPSCSEGDLYAWWVIRHFPGKFMVKSGDADLLFIGLQNMEAILAIDPEREGWFVTPRSVGTVEHDVVGHELQMIALKKQVYAQALEEGKSSAEAFMASGGKPSERSIKRQRTADGEEKVVRTKRQWLRRYINMRGVYDSIHQEATSLYEHHRIETPNPIENFVGAFLLASKKHDYINCGAFVNGVGEKTIWSTYLKYQQELSNLIAITCGNDRITGELVRYYEVNVPVLRKFRKLCINEASARFKTETAQINCRARLKEKNKEENKIDMLAGQLAWTLQYWAVGADRKGRVEDGLLIVNGRSVYGFNQDGWTSDVICEDIKRCPYFEQQQ